ncbi:MAG: response regulator transcription factor [Gordonia paraffinivorans]
MAESVDRPPRIGVIDDHEISILGVAHMLSTADDLEFAGGAPTVDDLLATTHDVTLAVLDLRLEDGSSPHSNVETLRRHGIETLVHTAAEDAYLVRSAAAANVLGVVRKSTPAADMLEAIRQAARGEQVPTMDWAAAIDSDDSFVVDLSPRQREVLELYASGESTARVAQLTGMAADTVNQHLDRIRTKYASVGRPARNKTDLYKRAVEDGWLPIPRRLRG